MEQITACFLGTTMPHRRAIAEEVLAALDSCIDTSLVTNKLAAIDQVSRFKTGEDIRDFASQRGWKIIQDMLRPSMQAQFDLIEAAYSLPGNWILYCEDDVIVKMLPDWQEFEQIVNTHFGYRTPGMISLMHGGFSRGEETKQAHADWLNNENNWRDIVSSVARGHLYTNQVLLHRSDTLRDAHFFEFPVTIVRKDIFLACNLWAQKNRKGVHSETALTDAWFALGYDKYYCKVSWMQDPYRLSTEENKINWAKPWSFDSYDKLFLQKCLFVECFGNSPRLRQVPITGGISMAF